MIVIFLFFIASIRHSCYSKKREMTNFEKQIEQRLQNLMRRGRRNSAVSKTSNSAVLSIEDAEEVKLRAMERRRFREARKKVVLVPVLHLLATDDLMMSTSLGYGTLR